MTEKKVSIPVSVVKLLLAAIAQTPGGSAVLGRLAVEKPDVIFELITAAKEAEGEQP